MASVEYLGTGQDDGVNMGRSATDKIGFYGLTTPIVQPVLTPAVATTAATTTTPYGFTTLAQANHIVELLNLIRARLVALGIMV